MLVVALSALVAFNATVIDRLGLAPPTGIVRAPFVGAVRVWTFTGLAVIVGTVIRLCASFSEPMGDIMTGRKEIDDMSSLLTVAGVYRDGKVEFAERPAGVGEDVPVLVTFLPSNRGGESEPSAHAAEQARRAARERFLARLKQGMPFGGPPYPKREELYDRFDSRDENPR
jgi:hypothetical protein